MLKPGETLNRGAYRIERRLGAGGFGVVYLAEDVMLRRKVAIKTIREDVAGGDPGVAEAFYAEARLTAVLGHPYIIPIYSVGEEEIRGWRLPYVVMEYVEGGDLETVLVRARPALPQRLRWMQQIAEGLAYAHQQGVLHRDLKPRNVFVARNQAVKIGDFGLAKVLGTDTKTVLKGVGTPAYISPEQIQGRPADARADLYALGIMYYQMCTDRLPYVSPEGTDPTAQIMAIGYQHVHAAIPSARAANPEVPPDVDALIQHLMAKEPGARPASADEVALVLERTVSSAARASHLGAQPGAAPLAAPLPDTLTRPAVAEVTHARAAPGRGDTVPASGPEVTYARPTVPGTQPVPSTQQGAVAATLPGPAQAKTFNRKWLAIPVAALVMGAGVLFARSYMADVAGKREEAAQATLESERRQQEARRAEEARQAEVKAQEERKRASAGEEARRADEERQARLREEQRRLEEARRQTDQERKRAEDARLARLKADDERKRAEEARLREDQRRQQEAQSAEAERQARIRKELADTIEGSFRKAGLKNLAVAVSPERIVTLSGTVQDQREKNEALRLAMLPPGVTEVRQNITVLAPQPIAGDLQRRIEQRLRESGLSLTVEVHADQTVTLSGVLESEQKRQEAKTVASGVSGVRQVKDAIFIAPRSTGPVKIR